jgi:Protein of unknown function (DUF3097)
MPRPRTPDGILSGPIDLDRSRPVRPGFPEVEARPGLSVRHRVTGLGGTVLKLEHGMDHLADAIAELRPGPDRRLGVLLDHLVVGSKEARVAAAIGNPPASTGAGPSRGSPASPTSNLRWWAQSRR